MACFTGAKMNSAWLKNKRLALVGLIAALVVTLLAATALPWGRILPGPAPRLNAGPKQRSDQHKHEHADDDDHHDHDHAGHKHSHDKRNHPGHVEANAVDLSQQAQQNIGVKLQKIELRSFDRTVSMPGIVVERPGRSKLHVTAPLTGVITEVTPIEGEALEPGGALFRMRLTHEDLVQAQSDFLRTLEELDVTNKEVTRLAKVSAGGIVAGKTLLEKQYEAQKQEAILRAQRQALLLHGLTESHIADIEKDRKLLQELAVLAPGNAGEQGGGAARILQVQDLKVEKGQHVNAGDLLCVLADHQILYIEATAFEQDVDAVGRAAKADAPITAVLETQGADATVAGLKILYLANRIEPDSRAFHFYVVLPNSLLRDSKSPEGQRFVHWRFRPGQRVHLLVPVETWQEQIVLPVDAVVEDSAESYVFAKNGDHFDRQSVHVRHRDARWVVIASDGSLKPGDVVSISGAQQMHNTLKNKTRGPVDPHAGHNH